MCAAVTPPSFRSPPAPARLATSVVRPRSTASPGAFFDRNLQVAGFTPEEALYATVRELAENACDACMQRASAARKVGRMVCTVVRVVVNEFPQTAGADSQTPFSALPTYEVVVTDTGQGIPIFEAERLLATFFGTSKTPDHRLDSAIAVKRRRSADARAPDVDDATQACCTPTGTAIAPSSATPMARDSTQTDELGPAVTMEPMSTAFGTFGVGMKCVALWAQRSTETALRIVSACATDATMLAAILRFEHGELRLAGQHSVRRVPGLSGCQVAARIRADASALPLVVAYLRRLQLLMKPAGVEVVVEGSAFRELIPAQPPVDLELLSDPETVTHAVLGLGGGMAGTSVSVGPRSLLGAASNQLAKRGGPTVLACVTVAALHPLACEREREDGASHRQTQAPATAEGDGAATEEWRRSTPGEDVDAGAGAGAGAGAVAGEGGGASRRRDPIVWVTFSMNNTPIMQPVVLGASGGAYAGPSAGAAMGASTSGGTGGGSSAAAGTVSVPGDTGRRVPSVGGPSQLAASLVAAVPWTELGMERPSSHAHHQHRPPASASGSNGVDTRAIIPVRLGQHALCYEVDAHRDACFGAQWLAAALFEENEQPAKASVRKVLHDSELLQQLLIAVDFSSDAPPFVDLRKTSLSLSSTATQRLAELVRHGLVTLRRAAPLTFPDRQRAARELATEVYCPLIASGVCSVLMRSTQRDRMVVLLKKLQSTLRHRGIAETSAVSMEQAVALLLVQTLEGGHTQTDEG